VYRFDRLSLLSVLLLLALPRVVSSAVPDAERPVRLCVDPAWAPFEYLDEQGQHRGMAAEYWQRMTERSGLRTEVVVTTSWEASLARAKRRDCDLLTLAMKTPERSEFWLFTEPYVSYPFVLATRAEAPSVSRLAEVADKTLAAVKGYAYTELVRQRYPRIRFLEVENIAEGLERVRRGEAYGLIDSLATVAFAIQQAQLHELKVAGRFEDRWELSIAVRNDRPEWLPFFSAMTQTLTADDRGEIENRWLAAWVESPPDLRWLWVSIVVLALSALVVAFFVWRQRQATRLAVQLEQLNQALTQARDLAERSEARYAELAKQSRSYAWDVDADGLYTDVSASVETVLGYRPEALLGLGFWEIIPAEQQVQVRELGLSVIREGRSLAGFENQVVDRGGRVLWVSTSGVPIRDEAGAILGFRGIDIDVDERRRQRDLLQHYAFHDGLTGIANRRLFLERLEDALAHVDRHELRFSVLLVDLDHFKRINDTYGHAAGDALLCQFAERAQGCLRRGDLLARLGGEEFAVLLFESSAEGAVQTAERMRAAIAAEPMTHECEQIPLRVSIGVARIRQADTPESLLARADAALYAAKQSGRNRVVLEDPDALAAEPAQASAELGPGRPNVNQQDPPSPSQSA
jgi:diguanylate cyclase (GGDEF)-like protein/PAS domain S-box-containing protein